LGPPRKMVFWLPWPVLLSLRVTYRAGPRLFDGRSRTPPGFSALYLFLMRLSNSLVICLVFCFPTLFLPYCANPVSTFFFSSEGLPHQRCRAFRFLLIRYDELRVFDLSTLPPVSRAPLSSPRTPLVMPVTYWPHFVVLFTHLF